MKRIRAESESMLLDRFEQELRRLLPATWQLTARIETRLAEGAAGAVRFLRVEGTRRQGALANLAVQAIGDLPDPETTPASLAFLVQDLLDSYETLG